MASEVQGQGKERAGRKLTKKRRESKRVSLDIPERFKDGADADDDVTAPKRNNTISMNQSVFALIARAGHQSQTDLSRMEEVDSGDSDGEGKQKIPYHSLDGAARVSRLSSAHDFQAHPEESEDSKAPKKQHKRAMSEHKLLRSLPKMRMSSRKESKSEAPPADGMSSSQFLPPRPSPEDSTTPSLDAPPLRHKSKVTPGQEIHVEKRRASEKKGKLGGIPSSARGKDSVTLAQRLQQIFDFEDVEEVISEYPCWLLQSILLQGYMYITQKHICFYAYIPKKHHDVGKSGYLFKRGRSKYNRYWFTMKGDVLAYYTNPTELYFPRNRINLQYAISAEVLETKDKNKDETTFVVTTDEKVYQFRADSAMSAKEWVRSIQKVIFRTHNEGNSVKISLPIHNVLEIEESTILDFAETVKVRVIDNDETYAIDEYFFSFFHHGQDALTVLRIMINDNEHHQAAQRQGEQSMFTPTALDSSNKPNALGAHGSSSNAPHIEENVRATLSRLPAPLVGRSSMSADSRSSTDINRKSLDVRRSMDASHTFRHPSYETRRSFSGTRQDKQPRDRLGDNLLLSPKPHDTSDSATNSLGPGTESSAAIQSIDESSASASQILSRSDVFNAPALQAAGAAASEQSDSLTRSQDTTRSSNGRKPHLKAPQPSHRLPGSPNALASLGTPDVEDDQDAQQMKPRLSGSSTALQDITMYPLKQATGLAGFLRTRSKKMGSLLATESMGYYEKVSGMLAGGRKHYTTADGLQAGDQIHDLEEDEDAAKAAEHFREHFAFPETEQLQSSYFASLQRIFPNYGKIYISGRYFCFRSLMPTVKTKIILPMRDIENVSKEKGFRLGYHGLVVMIRGHEELFFEFSKAEYRDECAISILRTLESTKYIEDERSSSSGGDSDDETAKAEHDLLQEARQESGSDPAASMQFARAAEHDRIPLIFDDPLASIVDFKPPEALRIVCLTIGTRGDVQPYIALCKELIKEGHKPKIATHAEFESSVREQGIDFACVGGDPTELMRICVEHGMFTFSFLREAHSKFRGWLDEVLKDAWEACQDADLLIESPSAMAGIHIAEALEIPYFRAFGMPWSRTRAYPHAFSVPDIKMGGAYNHMSYVLFDNMFWTGIMYQVNKWRRTELGLQNTTQRKMQQHHRPFLYCLSPSVVPPPLDWPDWIRVTGYWFLDAAETYIPPKDIVAFIAKAHKDGKKLVYIGFGSIVVDDPAAMTKMVVESVLKADVRCVLSKGWSDRLKAKDASKPEIPLPPEIYQVSSIPHDWLFTQMDAAVHHGGSGTTGASLRAGIPTIIKPFFGDQYFFAGRVEDLGVGIWLKKANTSVFSRALWEATNSQRMIIKAKVIGEKIRKENGTQIAIQTIYREMDRAKAFVNKNKQHDNDSDLEEEDWTMIDDDEGGMDPNAYEVGPAITGMNQDASRTGHGSLVLGSVVTKGAANPKPVENSGRTSESTSRE